MAYTSGKHAFGICDRTGFRYDIKDLVFEVENGVRTGLRVGYDVVDIDARPDRLEPATERLLLVDPFTTAAADSGSTVITVVEKSHGRATSDRVRFRNCVGFDGITSANFELAEGYVITKTTDDAYTISISASSTTGSVTGGGVFVTVGPVSLEA